MKRLAFLLITSLACLALLAGTLPAQAQSRAISLASLQIELWPEYDRPTTLVQLSGTLDPGVALPAEVTVRLPAASGGPLAVATRSVAGNLVNAPYTTTVSGDQILVTLQADTADFHVEYYDPALIVAGQARTYTFRWTTEYAVAEAGVRVQAPVDSSGLTADPPVVPAGLGDDGLNYYMASLGALQPGELVTVRVNYSKTSSTLSATAVTQIPAAAAAAPAAQPGALLAPASPWFWAGIVACLLLLAAAGFGFARLRRGPEKPRESRYRRRVARPGRSRRLQPPAVEPSGAGTAAFCTQCGKRRLPDDRFCRGCGAPVER